MQVRALQDALRDPEGDAVDEVALPELERGGRRLLEAREVRQVAAERLPALGLGLAGLRPAPPERRLRALRSARAMAFADCAASERDEHDVAPAGRRGRQPSIPIHSRTTATSANTHERAAR